MANKEIKIIATLDMTDIKKQVPELKKAFDNIGFSQADLNELKKSFQDMAKTFAKELSDAMKSMKREAGTSGPGTGTAEAGESRGGRKSKRSYGDAGKDEAYKLNETGILKRQEIDRKVTKAARDSIEKFNEGGIETKSKEDWEGQKKRNSEAAALKKDVQTRRNDEAADWRDRNKRWESLHGKLQQHIKQRQGLEESGMSKMFQGFGRNRGKMGAGLEGSGILNPLFNSGAARMGGALLGTTGMIAGAAVAGVAMAGQGALSLMDAQRERRVQEAQKQFEGARLTVQGKGIESILRKQGRERGEGGIEGFLGGLKEVVTSPLALGAGTAGGYATGGKKGGFKGFIETFKTLYKTGQTKRGEQESETALKEAGLAFESLDAAKALRHPTMGLLRGGMRQGEVMPMIKAGANQGFSGEETLQQALSAQQFIGSRNINRRMGGAGDVGGGAGPTQLEFMQDLMQRTGVGVGEQAQTAEIFAGGGKTSVTSALKMNEEVLKKGVAAGLDVSKAGQFLKATAEFVQSNAGLGSVDVGELSTNLAEAAKSFANGKETTGFNVEQAKQFQAIMQQESQATEGVAGIGNYQNVLQSLGPNASADQIMMGLKVKGTDKAEDVAKAMGISVDQAQALISGKNGSGSDTYGELTGKGTYGVSGIESMERNMSPVEIMNMKKALEAQRTGGLEEGVLPPSTTGTDVGKSLRGEALAQAEQLGVGFSLLGEEAKHVTTSLGNLTKQLDAALTILKKHTGIQIERNP